MPYNISLLSAFITSVVEMISLRFSEVLDEDLSEDERDPDTLEDCIACLDDEDDVLKISL